MTEPDLRWNLEGLSPPRQEHDSMIKYAEYQNKYRRENVREFKLKFNKLTEKELLDWINQKKNVQGYLKELILKDMREKRNEL